MYKRHTGTHGRIRCKFTPRVYTDPADSPSDAQCVKRQPQALKFDCNVESSAPAPAEDVSFCKEPARMGLAKIRYLNSSEFLQPRLEFRKSL